MSATVSQEPYGCKEAMSSELVLQHTEAEMLKCITEHPGFNPVCIQKSSLEMAADLFKVKTKQRYQQTGDAEEK